MPTYTQADRPLRLTTPLGPDKLLLIRLHGQERLSTLFRFELEMLADNETVVDFSQLLGQKVAATIQFADRETRYFSGVVSRISQGARDQTFTSYSMEVVPQLWFLTRQRQSRIFQYLTVPDILKKVFAGLNVRYEIQGTFEAREYCVQYRETDFDFASRLMEEEGIYYFFEHAANGHTLVLANTPQSHPDCNPATLIFEEIEGGNRPEERVFSWQRTQELRSGKTTLWDHSFELPGKHLESSKTILDSVQVGEITQKLKTGNNDKLEIYDYPGGYANRFDGVSRGGGDSAAELQKIFNDGPRTVEIRMQEEAAQGLEIRGVSTCVQLTAGYRFKLDRHFNADGDYVLVALQHTATLEGEYRSGRGDVTLNYSNTFTAIPLALPFRPPRVTRIPRVYGAQTAVVVGPAGEEIFTDKYGRIKVQFPWDREGKNDGDSSCWVRVATPWAGKQWGMIHIPRMGQEVVVEFVDGDVDHPLVVGSVYNAEQMPPYTLPANKTQSGVKSRSSLSGTPSNYNEIRFEDKKANEQILIHAEKNQDIEVENDETHWVGHDRTKTIDHDETTRVKHDRTETVDNDETITIHGNRTETVDKDETITIHGSRAETVDKDETIKIQNNRAVTISQGNESLNIKMGNSSTKLDLGKSQTEAMQSIELKVGQSSIKIDQMGVTITGMMIKIDAKVQADLQAVMTNVKGNGIVTVKGGLTMIN
jgi:type VI secretion system secreted protein VgrG